MGIRRAVPVMLGLLLVGGIASAQIPDEFENLKVLPKDIGKRDLVDAMRKMASGLGVRCSHCHPGGADAQTLDGVDFATDELGAKKVARGMLQMTMEINKKMLPGTGRRGDLEISCVTCHRGLTSPATLTETLGATLEEDGVEAAIARYRVLREEHYGSGAYDFSQGSLNSLAEDRARSASDVPGAIRLMELNVEMNDDSAYAWLLLGQMHAQNGDKAAAVAAIEKSLAVEPDNRWAKQMLERVQQMDD